MQNTKKISTQTVVLGAVLTALVIILQYLGAFIKFGPFSISLVLIPIVIGAATCGKYIAAWLGLVFGFAVLMSGDAGAFLAVNPLGTVVTVLLKGTLCGLASGAIYGLLSGKNSYLAVAVSAVLCPIVNTGVFLIGCQLFFMPTIVGWALSEGFGANAWQYIIVGMVGINFLVELAINIILCPIIVRLLNVRQKQM
ncbi:MAG: ECF transporter S component [Clostridia bacterium]|nr:ECF transporter S component [Clostridia bacterium]